MKTHLTTLFLFISLSCFAQSSISDTDSKNELSLYLKEEISKKLLKKASYPKGKSFITASFCIDKNDEIYNFTTSNGDIELNARLREAFENYPIDKLVPSNRGQAYKYSLKIITKKGSKNIFNCSNQFDIRTSNYTKNCQKYEQYPDIQKCFSEALKKHMEKDMNPELLFSKNTSSAGVSFKVSNRGKLFQKKQGKKTPKSKEIDRLLKSYPEKVIPATLNGKPVSANRYVTIRKSEPTKEDVASFATLGAGSDSTPISNIQKYSKPSTTSNLSHFIKEHLSQNVLNKANLNEMNTSVLLRFHMNSKYEYTNINVNARSRSLRDSLIAIFKTYPFEQLGIENPNSLNLYTAQLLSYESGATVVNASSKIVYESLPIYKGCEKSKSTQEAKKCFSSSISKHFNRNFNSGLSADLGLPTGGHRILCMFKFSGNGEVSDIQVKAPHDVLKEEAIRTIKKMPTLAAPGIQNGKPVSVRYVLPISFLVSSASSSNAPAAAIKKPNKFKPGNVNF